ncbi:DNA-binding protein YbiB [Pantoea sp. Mhis]|uniref:DNA-binding protein YbiB n=1 Tax=Pantoea sp. Mhis TaxID=2576759 RepID=UPI0013587132|nr:DNA-binding protein YbiB [Pantoea sp. Mhis]MXP56116.1 DNA-binding protein YbiB [Pantoea sp. Mhis]
MELDKIIKNLGYRKIHVHDIDHDTAFLLYKLILDNKIPDLELGSILIALRLKGETIEEISGFYQAMKKQIIQLYPPIGKPMPIVIPSYNGSRRLGNLTPLLGLLLVKLGFPVIIHGINVDYTRVTTKEILTAMDIKSVKGSDEAQDQLNKGQLTFITTDHFCKPMAKQLSLRWRMGVRNIAHTLIKLANPFEEGAALRISSVSHPEYLSRIIKFYCRSKTPAIVLKGTEGEVYANPQNCPNINIINNNGDIVVMQANKNQSITSVNNICFSKRAKDTAKWIIKILENTYFLPSSLRTQLICCLIASGEAANIEDAEMRLQKCGI